MRKYVGLLVLSLLFSDSLFATILGAPTACSGYHVWYVDSAGVTGGVWSSSNTAVGTIDAATGVAMALSPGTTTISYVTPTNTSTTVLTVTPLATPISGGPLEFCTGTSVTFSNGTPGGTWSSANPGIATADAMTGAVTGISPGVTNIEYNMGGCGSIISVTINATVPDTPTGPSGVCPGGSITLSAIAAGGTWSSSAPAIASVSSSGVVTGISTGTANIIYTIPGTVCGPGSSYRTITVSTSTDPGTVSGYSTFPAGTSAPFTATVSGGVWSSSNTLVATVSAGGIVTGVSAGSCVISYAVTGCSGVAYVTMPVSITPALLTSNIGIAESLISTYPNPASNTIYVSGNLPNTEQARLLITDIAGHELYSTQIRIGGNTGQGQVNTGGFSSGLYFIYIQSASANYFSKIEIQQ